MPQYVRDVMTQDVTMLAPDQTVARAAAMMRDEDIGAVPIAEEDRLIGMVTDRDVVIRAIAAGLDPVSAKVREIMSDSVLYCFDDESLETVADNMGEQQVRRLPVVNRDKRLVGIVSLGDVAVQGPDETVGDALEDISKPAAA